MLSINSGGVERASRSRAAVFAFCMCDKTGYNVGKSMIIHIA